MARGETLAIVDDQRVHDVVDRRVDGGGGSIARATAPVNDVESRSRLVLDDHVQRAFEHKLLAPLSRIVDAAGLLEHQVDGHMAENVRAVRAAADRQSGMLRDVLAFVQSTVWGPLRAHRRRMDLRVLCERFLDAVQERHPDRAIALVSSRRVEGEWDPDLLANLLSHLVGNALEHGFPDKVVRITVRALDDAAVIEVTSAGPELDEDVLRRLFEPFNSGPALRSDASEGLGLGLFLANEVARAHGGRIDVWSDPIKGTTFRVTLPRS